MTTQPCPDRRGDVAMLALGRLDPADAARVQAHVDGCETCRRALVELRRTAALLPLVDPEVVRFTPSPPADLADRIVQQVRAEQLGRRSRRRRRTILTMAAAAVLILVIGITALVVSRDGDTKAQEFAIAAPGVEGTFWLQPNDQGTAIHFEHRGLDPDDVYWLWLTDSSGDRVSAGTFHGSDEGSTLVLQSAMDADRAVRIWVTDADDEVVLDSLL